MITDLITFGGVLFWAILAIVVLVLTVQIHEEKVGWATVTLLATVAFAVGFTSIAKTLRGVPPIYYLYAVLAYLVGAAVWAVIKWRAFYLPKLFRKYDEYRARFLLTAGPNGQPLKEMPADPKVVAAFKNSDVKYLNIEQRRMASHNKGRITTWMIFWIPSLIETFFGDFLANIFEYIYNSIANGLQRMSDRMASKYSELN